MPQVLQVSAWCHTGKGLQVRGSAVRMRKSLNSTAQCLRCITAPALTAVSGSVKSGGGGWTPPGRNLKKLVVSKAQLTVK